MEEYQTNEGENHEKRRGRIAVWVGRMARAIPWTFLITSSSAPAGIVRGMAEGVFRKQKTDGLYFTHGLGAHETRDYEMQSFNAMLRHIRD